MTPAAVAAAVVAQASRLWSRHARPCPRSATQNTCREAAALLFMSALQPAAVSGRGLADLDMGALMRRGDARARRSVATSAVRAEETVLTGAHACAHLVSPCMERWQHYMLTLRRAAHTVTVRHGRLLIDRSTATAAGAGLAGRLSRAPVPSHITCHLAWSGGISVHAPAAACCTC
jgi:hypothetical protein